MFCIYGNLAILSNLALLYESTYWSFTSLRMIHFYLKFSKAPHHETSGYHINAYLMWKELASRLCLGKIANCREPVD